MTIILQYYTIAQTKYKVYDNNIKFYELRKHRLFDLDKSECKREYVIVLTEEINIDYWYNFRNS